MSSRDRSDVWAVVIITVMVALLVSMMFVNADKQRQANLQYACQKDGGLWINGVCVWSAP